MPEWIIAVAAAVQAVGIIVLVILTRRYARTVKQQVEQDRDLFGQRAADTAALVERQSREHEARQRERTEQAIRTIIAELEINSQQGGWRDRQSPPLLDSAYGASLWAVQLIGVKPMTFRALGDVYLSIKRYDLLYGAVAEARKYGDAPDKRDVCKTAWEDAQKAIRAALEALRRDPSTRHLAAVAAREDPH